jgi:hypothetical protein
VNWSEELRQLLIEERIEVDGIKISDWPHCLLPALGVARALDAGFGQQRSLPVEVQVHFALATCDGLLSDHELVRCWGFLQTTDTEIVNTHFRVPRDLAAGGRIEAAGLMTVAFAHLEQLANKFGREAIVVEHIPEPEWLTALGCYPALLCRLVRETGVGLLLDISHARLLNIQVMVTRLSAKPSIRLQSGSLVGRLGGEDYDPRHDRGRPGSGDSQNG